MLVGSLCGFCNTVSKMIIPSLILQIQNAYNHFHSKHLNATTTASCYSWNILTNICIELCGFCDEMQHKCQLTAQTYLWKKYIAP